METKTRKAKPLAKTVKDTIDFVYEYLSPFKDGCEFSAKDTGNQGRYVVRTLLRRGIISMKKLPGGKTHYTWIAEMAPTKVLYQSVAAEIRDLQREKNKKYYSSKVAAKTAENVIVDAPVEEPVQEPDVETFHDATVHVLPGLSALSDQELWDELKTRGYFIEDNRLVVVKKAYLD